jgi:hypothetical protein
MPRIRLLEDAPAGHGPLHGRAGDVLDVDVETAHAWADGIRAERVIEREHQIERAVERRRNSTP